MIRASVCLHFFLLLLILFLIPSCGNTQSPPPSQGAEHSKTKVMILGIDGVDWNVLNPLVQQGKAPNISKLMQSGVSARLRTLFPMRSPLIWTSIATGKKGEKHGIRDFVVDRKGDKIIPVTRTMRKAKAFWNILSETGITVGVVGWLVTWPVEEVKGYMVSSYLPFLHEKQKNQDPNPAGLETRIPKKGTIVEDIPYQFFPNELGAELLPMKRAPEDISFEDLEPFFREAPGPGVLEDPAASLLIDNLRWTISADEAYANIGLYLLDKYEPQVSTNYFAGTDVCGHRFWKYYDSASDFRKKAPWPEEEQRVFQQVLPGYYSYVDGLLGKYMEKAGEDTLLIVLSDHGMTRKAFKKESGVSGRHRQEGVLFLKGPGVKQGAAIQAHVLDITPTLLYYLGLPVAEDMDGKVLKSAFDEAFISGHPLRTISTYEDEKKPSGSEDATKSSADKRIEEHLRSLGYIE